MRFLYVVSVVTFWIIFITNAFLYVSDTEPRRAEQAEGKNDADLTLDTCDLIEALKLSSVFEVPNPLFYPSSGDMGIDNSRFLKQIKENLLASFFLVDRQRRQTRMGYNINSFGLRFGKRATRFNWDSVGLWFNTKSQPSIPIDRLQEIFCSE